MAIGSVDGWLAGLPQLPGYSIQGFSAEPVLRVLSPSNRSELTTLETARQSRHNADALEVELGTVFVAAARAGIPFTINGPEVSAEIRERIKSMPVEKVARFARF